MNYAILVCVEENRDAEHTDAPRYRSSVAALLAGVSSHTLRAYEKAGLIHPARTPGRIRLYRSADIEIARKVLQYTRRGVNLSGVKVLLAMESKHKDIDQSIGGW
jgi:MerR family transcriptional regulator/heat shock protein HspR